MRTKSDLNQAAIVRTFRQAGAFVQDLHTVGHGCPDLLVSFSGQWWAVEVKSKRGFLSPDQIVWHKSARAPVVIIRSCFDVIDFRNDPKKYLENN